MLPRYSIVLILVLHALTNSFGQDSIRPISLPESKQVASTAAIDFFTSFSAMNVLNGESSLEANSLYLYYNFSVNNKLKAGRFFMTNYYFTELGIRKYLDSISCISDDQYNFKNSASYRPGSSRFAFNAAISIQSQYFKHFNYRDDTSGFSTRYLYTSYRSPGYINISGGCRFDFKDHYSIELGLVNGRKTILRNQQLFESRTANQLYGLNKGSNRKWDLGFNLVLTIRSHPVFKNFYVENFSQFNAGKNDLFRPENYIVDINNAFHYRFLKHFRLTLRTKAVYDPAINRKLKITNHLTLGFYLNNTF
jgi:hypothetical protein